MPVRRVSPHHPGPTAGRLVSPFRFDPIACQVCGAWPWDGCDHDDTAARERAARDARAEVNLFDAYIEAICDEAWNVALRELIAGG